MRLPGRAGSSLGLGGPVRASGDRLLHQKLPDGHRPEHASRGESRLGAVIRGSKGKSRGSSFLLIPIWEVRISRSASPVFLIYEELVFSRYAGFLMSFRSGSTPLEEKFPRGLIWILFSSKGNGILNDVPGETAKSGAKGDHGGCVGRPGRSLGKLESGGKSGMWRPDGTRELQPG